MTQAINYIKQPLWWFYSATAWTQLVELLVSLNINSIEQILQQKNWITVNGGVTNFNYQLVIAEQQFFVQIIDSQKLQRLPSQQFVPSHQVMEKNKQLNHWLAKCFYESKELRVFEWLDAKKTSLQTLNKNPFNNQLVDFLTDLHSNISVLPILNIQQHLTHYYQMAIKRKPLQKNHFKAIYDRALLCAKSFSASKNCHNDLSPGNILYTQHATPQLVVVDWEYACISDPFFDIAGIAVNFSFDETQEYELIQNYSEKMGLYANLKKYYELKELYQLVNQLWCA